MVNLGTSRKAVYLAALFAVITSGSLPISAFASERCIDSFQTNISKVSAELSQKLRQQLAIDTELMRLAAEQAKLNARMGAIMGVDPSMAYTKGQLELVRMNTQMNSVKRARTKLANEAHDNNARIVELRHIVPVNLQRKMRDCAIGESAARTPTNFAVQGFVLAATGAMAVDLPYKSSYIPFHDIMPEAE